MYTNLIVAPEIVHGTPAGYASCRSNGGCDNHQTGLMTCMEAAMRYRGDAAYAKQVDAGNAPLEPEQFAPDKPTRAPKAKKVRKARTTVTSKPRPTNGVIGPDGLVHGTPTGYRRCKNSAECPATAAGKPSCLQAGRDYYRVANERKRRAEGQQPARAAKHGTASGYTVFKCRAGAPCPAPDGATCSDASAADRRAYYQKQKAARA